MPLFKRKQRVVEVEPAPISHKKLGLALSGGGLRGFAHLGALKAFEEDGIEFDVVAGTSAGAFVGALYALEIPYDQLLAAAETIKPSDIKGGLSLLAPSDPNKIGAMFTRIAGEKSFSDCKKKFIAVSCDLRSGNEVLIEKGNLADAVSASCAVPLIFKPFQAKGMNLVDGGLKNNIPSLVTRLMGADIAVAVDINSARGYGTNSVKAWDVLWASFRIMQATASHAGLANAHILIAPDMSAFSSASKDGWRDMIARGYEAAKEKTGKIKELLNTTV